jgi:hypothetical protein
MCSAGNNNSSEIERRGKKATIVKRRGGGGRKTSRIYQMRPFLVRRSPVKMATTTGKKGGAARQFAILSKILAGVKHVICGLPILPLRVTSLERSPSRLPMHFDDTDRASQTRLGCSERRSPSKCAGFLGLRGSYPRPERVRPDVEGGGGSRGRSALGVSKLPLLHRGDSALLRFASLCLRGESRGRSRAL